MRMGRLLLAPMLLGRVLLLLLSPPPPPQAPQLADLWRQTEQRLVANFCLRGRCAATLSTPPEGHFGLLHQPQSASCIAAAALAALLGGGRLAA